MRVLATSTLIVFGIILSICAFGSDKSAGCHNTNWVPDSTITYEFTFDGDGRERDYIVHIPSNYYKPKPKGKSGSKSGSSSHGDHKHDDKPSALPVVYALPGYGISPSYWRDHFGLQQQANEYNYIVVITMGAIFESPIYSDYFIRSWNDLSCTGSPANGIDTCDRATAVVNWGSTPDTPLECADGGITVDGVEHYNACNWCDCTSDDIGYLRALTKHIQSEYCVDISRQYVIGFSNGGMMTQRMACEANDIFAGAAAFHGQMHRPFNCKPKYEYPMPFMNIWGLQDDTVPGLGIADIYGWFYLTVQEVQDKFGQHNGCDMSDGMESVSTVSDGKIGWQCKQYNKDCKNDAYTQLCQWDGPHDYPTDGTKFNAEKGYNVSSSPPGDNFGMRSAWQFLSQYQREKNGKIKKRKSNSIPIQFEPNKYNNNNNNNDNNTYRIAISSKMLMLIGYLFIILLVIINFTLAVKNCCNKNNKQRYNKVHEYFDNETEADSEAI